jgi:putative flippase GtrA
MKTPVAPQAMSGWGDEIIVRAEEFLPGATKPKSLATAARKLARYATVSAISTTVTLSLLGAMIYTDALSPGWANVVATAIGTVPSFELNRRWVWAKHTRRSILKEIVPFCLLSFSGLGLSTLMVSLAAAWSTGHGLGSGATALISQAANLATFGALWVVQFVLLDRVLFGRRSGQVGAAVAVSAGAGPRAEPGAGAEHGMPEEQGRARPKEGRALGAPSEGRRPDGAPSEEGRPGPAGANRAIPTAALPSGAEEAA